MIGGIRDALRLVAAITFMAVVVFLLLVGGVLVGSLEWTSERTDRLAKFIRRQFESRLPMDPGEGP